jgi:hypothetical protein
MSKIEVDAIEPQSGTTLTIGASGDTITIPSGATLTNSGTATGFGKVLQVITATDSTGRITSSTSFVTASNTMSVTITPSSASNKIFLIATGNLYQSTSSLYAIATIFRDATDLGASSDKGLTNNYSGGSDNGVCLSMSILDSPSTTSAITYQVYIRTTSGGSARLNESNTQGSLTAFEIAG